MREHALNKSQPPRIASLVPSLTELVIALGLRDHLVARTGFCVHPAEVVTAIPKVGGTKDVNLAKLRRLAPMCASTSTKTGSTPCKRSRRGRAPNGRRSSIEGDPQGAAPYPVVHGHEPWLDEVQQVLLSSEPYAFGLQHIDAAQALCRHAQVRIVDGELISWYGPRAAAGLRYLREIAA